MTNVVWMERRRGRTPRWRPLLFRNMCVVYNFTVHGLQKQQNRVTIPIRTKLPRENNLRFSNKLIHDLQQVLLPNINPDYLSFCFTSRLKKVDISLSEPSSSRSNGCELADKNVLMNKWSLIQKQVFLKCVLIIYTLCEFFLSEIFWNNMITKWDTVWFLFKILSVVIGSVMCRYITLKIVLRCSARTSEQ